MITNSIAFAMFFSDGGNRATSKKCGESRPEWGRMEKYALHEECQSAAVAHRAAGASLAVRIHPTGTKRMWWHGCRRRRYGEILLRATYGWIETIFDQDEKSAPD